MRRNRWHRWAMMATAVIVLMLFMAHPELRLLAALIDVVGIDLFAVFIGAQLWDYAKPLLLRLYTAVLWPAARVLYRLSLFVTGIWGDYLDAFVHQRFPNNGLRA